MKEYTHDELFGIETSVASPIVDTEIKGAYTHDELFGHEVTSDEVPDRTVGSTLKDVGISLAKGVVGAGQGLVGLADIPTGGKVGKALDSIGISPTEWQKSLSEEYSPAQQAAQAKVESAEGFVDTAKAMIENPSTIGHGIVETIPSMLAGGVIGKGALAVGTKFAPQAVSALGKSAPIVASALGEGTISAGQTAEEIRNQTIDKELTAKQSGLALASGIGTGIFGIVGGSLAKKLGFADPDTMIVSGLNPAKKEGIKGVAKSIIGGGITEGVFEELPQTVQETIFTNAALDKPLLEGVPEGAAQAIILGGVMGAGANLLPGKTVAPEKTPAELELERRAGNILGLEKPKLDESVKRLNDELTANQELLNDPVKFDARVKEQNIAPEELVRQIIVTNKYNQALLDKVNSGLKAKDEQAKAQAKKEYDALSPEEKAVRDAADKLNVKRQETERILDAQINTIDGQLEKIRRSYERLDIEKKQDPEYKQKLREDYINLNQEKNKLLNRYKQEVVQSNLAPYTTREERQKFYQDVWGADTIIPKVKDAKESYQVFEANDLLPVEIANYANGLVQAKAEQQALDSEKQSLKPFEENNLKQINDYADYIKGLREKFSPEEQAVIENYWQGVKKELNLRNEEMTPGTEAFMRKKFFETKLAEIEGNVKQDTKVKSEPTKKVVPSLAEQSKRQVWFQQIARDLGDLPEINLQTITPDIPRGLPGEVPGRVKSVTTSDPQQKENNFYEDELGVRVKDIPIGKGIDAGIADNIQIINDLGYKSFQSMSGLNEDYINAKDRYSPDGYISFLKEDLTKEQIAQIETAAKEAGITFEGDTDTYFQPSVTIRTGITASGKSLDNIRKEAGKQAVQNMLDEGVITKNDLAPMKRSEAFPSSMTGGYPSDIKYFREYLDRREKIQNELISQAGGQISNDEIKNRWNKFTQALSKNVKSSAFTNEQPVGNAPQFQTTEDDPLNNIIPGATYQGFDGMIHQFKDSKNRNFSSLTTDPKEVKERYAKMLETWREKPNEKQLYNEEYIKAIKENDLNTAQKIVDTRAKESGYTETVYHWGRIPLADAGEMPNLGTVLLANTPLTKEQKIELGSIFKLYRTKQLGNGLYVSRNPNRWEGYVKNGDGGFLVPIDDNAISDKFFNQILNDEKLSKFFNVSKVAIDRYENKNPGQGWKVYRNELLGFKRKLYDTASKNLKNLPIKRYKLYYNPNKLITGNDYFESSDLAYINKNKDIENIDDNEIKIVNPEAVKSADVITYDENGNVIPLSERFQKNKNNINFSVDENQNFINQVSLADIERAFPGQTVTRGEDGTISIQFKNGKGLTINSIQSAGQDLIELAIATGQMSKNGKILGITVGNKIMLDSNFADNKTLWHENKHVLDNLGLITSEDDAALNKEFNKLRNAGKLEFALSKHKDSRQAMVENRANMFAQIMVNREQYRNTVFGRVIQRVMDFFSQLFSFGKQTVSGLAREVESGRIYERQVAGQNIKTTVPMAEQVSNQWHSALENAVNGFQQKVGTPDQWKGMIGRYIEDTNGKLIWKGYPGVKSDEIEWMGLYEWLDEQQGKVTKDELVKFIAENNVKLEEVVKGNGEIPVKIQNMLDELNIKAEYDPFAEQFHFTNSSDDAVEYADLPMEIQKEIAYYVPEIVKYKNYQLPGGKNYKEMLITAPAKETSLEQDAQAMFGKSFMDLSEEEYKQFDKEQDLKIQGKHRSQYQSPHWEEPNILTHIRFNERTDADGNKVLFLEEVQSDWHQQGKKYGYKDEEHTLKQKLNYQYDKGYITKGEFEEGILNPNSPISNIPDGPFRASKSWGLLAMKRMIRYAAENGFDKIAWTTGQQQADRYGLSKSFDKIEALANPDGTFNIFGYKNGDRIVDKQDIQKEDLPNVVGQDLTDKIINQPWVRGEYSGLDLQVGGEGMIGFYDQMLPSMLNKEFNRGKWGNARVEQTQIGENKVSTEQNELFAFMENEKNKRETFTVLSLPITNRMKSKALREGMPMFKIDDARQEALYEYKKDPLEYKNNQLTGWIGSEGTYRHETGLMIRKNPDDHWFVLYYPGGWSEELTRNAKTSKILAIEKAIERIAKQEKFILDRNNSPMFEVREDPTQKISDETYNQMFAERNGLVRTIGQTLRMRGGEIKQLFDKGLGAISTRLKNVDPMLRAEIRNLDFRTAQKIVTALRVAHPLLEKIKQMSAEDKFVWDAARRNSDEVKIQQIASKYNMVEDQNKLRSVLNQIRQDAIDVGYDVGFIEEYWPRIIKDQEGFLQATKGISQRPVITDAIKRYADKLGMTVERFEAEYPEQAADIASNTILGRNLGIGGPGNIQARQYETVPPELNKFYMDSDAALMQYIYSMTKKIEARRFFGKVPERIASLKAEKKRKTLMLKEITNAERREELSNDLLMIEQQLDKYKLQRDYTENIGTYINDLRLSGRIQAEDEKTVRDILDARFHEHGTTGPINAYKNMAYIDVMGSPISALTQIGDLAWAMYVGKVWTPRGLFNTVKNIGKATSGSFRNSKYFSGVYNTFGGSEITKEDLGIERIAQEFADGTTLSSAVSWVFKKVGLERIDSIGKETLINNAFDNYKVMASTEAGRANLLKQIKPIFGTESEGVINDLLAGTPTDNIKMLLYHRLLDFQPVALSEMPEQYLKSGNGRVFYMLKTYTLKQFDVFRNEAWHNIKNGYLEGNNSQVIEGITNMIKLASLLTLANAGSDELKDWLLGKDVKFEDHVIENFLTMGGASKHLRMQTTREGLGSGLIGQILPPFKFVNSISKDLYQGYGDLIAGDTINFDHARIVESIPLGGKIYYWHYGRGEDYKKSSNEQEFSNVGKDVKLFKRQFENAQDKRTFLNSNLDKFKQMKLHENFQASLNRNQAVINKLKEIPQTTNVRERLGQLQAQRELILKRYFEVAQTVQ